MLPTDCKDDMDCPRYHICDEGDGTEPCPLTNPDDDLITRYMPIDWLMEI